jgi:transposase
MSGFIEGEDRKQATLFPERLDDYVGEDHPVRVIDVFIDDLDISGLGFKAEPAATGRPGYHPKMMLKLYVYGYLNRVQSSRRLEVEAQRNIELMWLTGRLAPDFKTIADFRKDNPEAIRLVCREAGGDRWQQVQGGEQPGQELHTREDEASVARCGVRHRALPCAPG